MFDDPLLQHFMNTFYGYGNYKGDYWFVGMEEGGGNSFTNIVRRLQDWDHRGRLELEDIVTYHAEIGVKRFFGSHPKLQPTWNRLIRIELSARGKDVHTENVRAYQKEHFGRQNSTNCLVELLPLPSPSLGHWLYAQHSQLPYLISREDYTKHYAPHRAEHLRQHMHEYKPKCVVFYSISLGYVYWWKRIAGVEFRKIDASDPLYIAKNEHTLFAITRHPVAKGVKNEYFHQVGKMLHQA
ncbi:hypothetical protein K9N68_32520 [Kovacikia minuta CCNUW1]|uniref:hypothetical protein n=1 Tax=Kovacikia minuta TaxID=2931930 RepID=UPI001CC9CF48|nr:hypothetical protein [Kovacikia minuta]UBF26189.1 hypothetical protein K9N68_32520 [Kovacikia minuta CCNUW1]